ncbi:M12 family metallopeptidase [Pseudoalteromonas rubra]|uniref:M12 family metallopeptidase n=1 Tax=Pseudoalteromonas rubra TaxID=43658 RepID=UPI002DBEFD5F|nr:M12 family metallopeptidase [Pseudoalteromonas rubra]MEC4087918.1 M12 family metallopeptidase [Pseudoalteromonas rubra]
MITNKKLFLLGAIFIPTLSMASTAPLNNSQPENTGTPEYLIDGDMVLDSVSEFHTFSANRAANTSGLDSAVGWPNGIVPFQLVGIASGSQNEKNILEAMEEIERASRVNFVHKTSSHSNYLTIYGHALDDEREKNKICSANIGYANGGRRQAWIPSYCSVGTAIHELLHILGYRHEHQRTDRDYHTRDGQRYSLTVNDRYVPCTLQSAFRTSSLISRSRPYDFQSIMHYSNSDRTGCTSGATGKAFSYQNLDTGAAINTLGNFRMSNGDLQSLRDGYGRNRSQTPVFLGSSHKDETSLRISVVWYQVHDYPDYFRVNETSEEFIDINRNGRLDVGTPMTYRISASNYWRDAFEIYFGDSLPEKKNGYRYRFTVEACWDGGACSSESAAQTISVLQRAREPEPYIEDNISTDKEFYVRWNSQPQVQYFKAYRNGSYLGQITGNSLKQSLPSGTYKYEIQACNARGCSDKATLTHKHSVKIEGVPTSAPRIDDLIDSDWDNIAEFGFYKVARATEYRFRIAGQGLVYTGSIQTPYQDTDGGYKSIYRKAPDGRYQVSITACNINGCGPTATETVSVWSDF